MSGPIWMATADIVTGGGSSVLCIVVYFILFYYIILCNIILAHSTICCYTRLHMEFGFRTSPDVPPGRHKSAPSKALPSPLKPEPNTPGHSTTWTLEVRKGMAIWATLRGLGPLFADFLGPGRSTARSPSHSQQRHAAPYRPLPP